MARYQEKNYTVETALQNIGESFWQRYCADLKKYAQNPQRKDIVEKIHAEWDKGGLSPFGTDIRIEWAVAIYQHGDWEKAAASKVPPYDVVASLTDQRRKYPAEFRCDNGVYVRSLSELFIAQWLYANRITFEYERKVYFASCNQSALCDFYLPDYDVYVEFWGMEENEQYAAYKLWKEPLYRHNGYRLVSLHFEDLKNFRDSLRREMKACGAKK